MSRVAIAYGASFVVLLVLDGGWLAALGPTLYKNRLGPLLLPQPQLWAAGLFYLLYTVGVTGLAVLPGVRAGQWLEAAAYGALLGATAYGTYDLTNLATLRGWSGTIVVVDIVWGTILTAVAAGSASWAAIRWG